MEQKPKKLAKKTLLELVREFPERMRETEQNIKEVLGPDGMREVLCLDSNLDPVEVATIAASLAPSQYSPADDRRAIVRAAMLLTEARKILKEGPTIFDAPRELRMTLIAVWNHPVKPELEQINNIADPNERFIARARFITQQDRRDRAETDLFEMLGDLARKRSESDIPAYKEQYKESLSRSAILPEFIIKLRDYFADWKAKSKSAKAAMAGTRSRSKSRYGAEKQTFPLVANLQLNSAKRPRKPATRGVKAAIR